MIQDWSNIYVQNLGAAQRKLGIVAAAFMPPGGLTGQVIAKDSPVNFDISWHTVLGPGGIVTVGNGLALGAPNALHFSQAAAYTVGDLFAATGVASIAPILDVATGNVLLSGGVGVLPLWGKAGLTTHVTGVLPVANGGTGTGTAFTTGSVVFAGAGGVYLEDNAAFVWDNTNNSLGVGVAAPTARLHLPAAQAAADTASLKIDPGTVATIPVSGCIESDGTHLYWTDSGGIRRQLDN
jgi:hypothetical protein